MSKKHPPARSPVAHVGDVELRPGIAADVHRGQLARVILNELSEAVLLLSPDGSVLEANRPALEGAGVRLEDVRGRPLWETHWCEASLQASDRVRDACRRAARGETDRFEIEVLGADSGETPVAVEFSVAPVRDTGGRILFLFVSARMIEEGARQPELARRAEESQEAHETQRAQAEALRMLNEELDSLNYSVSHDLRAPLRGIEGFSQMLLEQAGDKLDQDGREFLHRIHNASERMSRLIDDLLVLSRTQRAQMQPRRVDLSRLAEEILLELKRSEPARQVHSTVQPGLIVTADKPLMRTALQNLLRNAWKFTLPREPAVIEFGSTELDGRTWFFVRDNGVGFEASQARRLFQPFQRLHHQDEFSGSGIGLAQARRILARHGGDIRAEGAKDRGATFYFRLGNPR